ncbi:MAG: transglutaminase-like cysteine peptidase [Rhizobiaceae bacterium]|nr:transglutaminase-like cysteine peptidase [Rhizobiaceae bacterium]
MRTSGWVACAILAGFATGANSHVYAANNSMVTGGRTTQPIGHYEFCKRLPTECKPQSIPVEPMVATRSIMSKINAVNSRVNNQIVPKTDMEIWGKDEVWSFPNGVGDCEDYVLEKRRLLIEAGFSPSNALITVVRQPNGEGHAVLTVRTTAGDFILDNLEAGVRRWDETLYTYLKRQSEKNPGQWLSITDGRADAVASVR